MARTDLGHLPTLFDAAKFPRMANVDRLPYQYLYHSCIEEPLPMYLSSIRSDWSDGEPNIKEVAINKYTYAEPEEEDIDLRKLQVWLEKIRKLDFYGSALAEDAAARLRACEELLDAYARRVFDAHDENR